jgi:hypothetical protein
MGVVQSLTAWGVLRAAEVVEIAAGAGLELASAATMLEKESGGGRNVWGHDGVNTGGFYTKGAAVTRESYEVWKPHRSRLGSQGVGPTQLTYPPLQDQADRLGGCWDWRVNVTVGFRHLAELQRQYGIRGGFRRYNGSGPAAESYADDSMARRAKWQTRIGPVPTPAPTPTPPQPARRASSEEHGMYIKCESSKGGPVWTGLLTGGFLVGPMSPGETSSADSNIKDGAVVQWVERSTWDALVVYSRS